MAKRKTPETKIVIEPQWINVLRELDKQLQAKNHDTFLSQRIPLGEGEAGEAGEAGWGLKPINLSTLDNEELSFMELTAIGTTKNYEDIADTFDVTYEEDEDSGMIRVRQDSGKQIKENPSVAEKQASQRWQPWSSFSLITLNL